MVFKKLKDVLERHRQSRNESVSKRMGFDTVSQYHLFKQKAKEEAREKANKINQTKLKDKIQKRVIESRTTSTMDQMVNLATKAKDTIDAINGKPKKTKTKKKSDSKKKNKKPKKKVIPKYHVENGIAYQVSTVPKRKAVSKRKTTDAKKKNRSLADVLGLSDFSSDVEQPQKRHKKKKSSKNEFGYSDVNYDF